MEQMEYLLLTRNQEINKMGEGKVENAVAVGLAVARVVGLATTMEVLVKKEMQDLVGVAIATGYLLHTLHLGGIRMVEVKVAGMTITRVVLVRRHMVDLEQDRMVIRDK